MYRLDEKLEDDKEIGGKAASLNKLFSSGVNVPHGFVLSASLYKQFTEFNNLDINIPKNLSLEELSSLSEKIKKKVLQCSFPSSLEKEIYEYYDELSKKYNMEEVDVAVRSSSIGEDSSENSFAGQQDTYLNITRSSLIFAIVSCYSSLFNLSAISYRMSRNLNDFRMAVVIQKMVRADSAGVAFSIDTETGFDKVCLINSNFGLGESVVAGEVEPDEFIYFKETKTIISSRKGRKIRKVVSLKNTDVFSKDIENVKYIETTETEEKSFSLKTEEAKKIGDIVVEIEKEYGFPVDVEWAIEKNELYILQARPETINNKKNGLKKYILKTDKTPICSGVAVGQKIGTGKVKKLNKVDFNFSRGDILVATFTTPDFEPIMKMAGGIITASGGRTCHAAIVARELGIPAIVGSHNCLDILQDGQDITISCDGEIGYVFDGILPYETEDIDISDLFEKVKKIPMKIKINAGFPDTAFANAYLPTNGVGLTRLEFIISSIGIHPRSLLEYDSLPDDVKIIIDSKINGEEREKYYIDGISNGVSKIAASVYPHEVIVRFSDFKTNEYRSLIGGEFFEPLEENSMLGQRGAYRYYSNEFKESFKLECLAIENVRNVKGLKNVAVMIPFCRTIEELLKVKKILSEYDLKDMKLYLMCEIPSNVILAEEFAEHIHGFSIGSNDLTQLTLGIDRDNTSLKTIGDERNPAVKKLISKVIKKAHKKGISCGICGQGPSDYPDFAQFLLEEGIDSISVTPDSFISTVNSLSKLF